MLPLDCINNCGTSQLSNQSPNSSFSMCTCCLKVVGINLMMWDRHALSKYNQLIQTLRATCWKVNPLITIIACERGAIHEHSFLGYVIISCITLVTRDLTNIVHTRARKIQGRHKVGRKAKRGGENRRFKAQSWSIDLIWFFYIYLVVVRLPTLCKPTLIWRKNQSWPKLEMEKNILPSFIISCQLK